MVLAFILYNIMPLLIGLKNIFFLIINISGLLLLLSYFFLNTEKTNYQSIHIPIKSKPIINL